MVPCVFGGDSIKYLLTYLLTYLFQGNVPDALRRLHPEANISRSGWLDGLDPLFARISDLILNELIADFGRTGYT